MNSRIQVARRAAFHKQQGKCFYCECDMWECTIESKFDACRRLFGVPLATPGLKLKVRLGRCKCTAEHLIKQADKGGHQDENIVAACMDCNTKRGNLTVEEYIILVRDRQNGETSQMA